MFQLSVLIFEFFDLIFLDAQKDVLFLKVLFEEDVVDFVPLLNYHKVIIGVGQLADIVLKLD